MALAPSPNEALKDKTPAKEGSIEAQKGNEPNLEAIKKRAEKVPESGDKDADAIARLRTELTPEQQQEGMMALQSRLMTLVVNLKEVGVDVTGLKKSPEQLTELVQANQKKLEVKLGSQEALAKLIGANVKFQMLLKEQGPTSTHLKGSEFWIKTIGESLSIWQDPVAKWKEYYQNDKAITLLATGAVALGVALSVKWLFSSKKEEGKASDKEKSWAKPLLIAAAVGLPVALYLGKDKIFDWMAKSALEKIPSKEAQEAYEKAKKEGTELPEPYRKEIEGMGEAGKELLKEIKPAAPQTPTLEAPEVEPKGAGETGKEGEITRETAEKEVKAGAFDAATTVFLTLYFHEKRSFSGEQKLIFKQTINDLAGTPFKEIQEKYEATKARRSITKAELPEITVNIGNEDLFLLLEGIVKMSRFSSAKNKPTVSIKELFERVWDNPFFDKFSGLTASVKTAMQSGDISGAIEAVASDGIEFGKENMQGMMEQLDQQLGIELGNLTEEGELETYRALQFQFLNTSQVYQDPKEALDNILKTHENYREQPEALAAAEKFFVKVKTKTPDVLGRIYSNFEVKKEGKPNYLVEGVNFENLSFAHACEFIALESTLDEGNDSGESLLILSTILRSFNDQTLKDRYVGTLIVEIQKGAPKIKIPGIKKIAPIFDKMVGVAAKSAWYSFLQTMEVAQGWASEHPTSLSSDEFAEAATENTIVSFLHEGIGTSLEIAEDSLAAIVLTLPESARTYLFDCETGEDFLKLIRVNGGTVALTEGRDGAAVLVIEMMGEIFLARPGKILIESFQAFPDVIDVSKIVAVGSAPFMLWGGMSGLFRTVTVPGGQVHFAPLSRLRNAAWGSLEGLTYPFKAPTIAYRGAKRVVQAAGTFPESARVSWREARAKGERLWHWGEDALKYKNFGQNVENMAITSRTLDRHFAHVVEVPERVTPNISPEDWKIVQGYKKMKAGATNAYNGVVTLIENPKEAGRRFIDYDFHLRLAERAARQLGEQLNNFFDFDQTNGFHLLNLDYDEIERIRDSHRRLRGFGDYILKKPHVEDELKLFAEIGDKDKLYDEALKRFKETGLTDTESAALARKVKKNPKQIVQIFEQVKKGIIKYETLAEAGSKPKISADAESSKPSENPRETLNDTEKKLAEIEKKMAAAEKEIADAAEAHAKGAAKAGELQPKIDQAREVLTKGEVARANLENLRANLDEVTRLEAQLAKVGDVSPEEAARLMAIYTERSRSLGRLSEMASKTLDFFNTGKLGVTTKFLGGVMGGLGVGFSATSALSSAHEAWYTRVEGRRGIKSAEALMWAANTGLDSAAVAVMLGAKGTAVTAASELALPVLPIAYAGSAVLETLNEDTKTDYEWIQANPYEVMHHFYTTAHSFSFGESMIVGGKTLVGKMAVIPISSEVHISDRMKEKRETMHKIYRGMMAMQKNPHLIDLIFDGRPSSEVKNKEIEAQIQDNYTPYHEFYFQHSLDSVSRYNEVQKAVLEAQMFDDIMSQRQIAKANGRTFKLGNIALNSDDYDVPEGKGWSLEKAPYFKPFQVVQAYKEEAGKVLDKDPIVSQNLERADTAYLVKLYVQIDSVLHQDREEIEKESGLMQALKAQAIILENYLEIKRGINFELAIRNPEYRYPKMSLSIVKENLEGLGKLENKAYLEFERLNYDLTPGVHSLYKLAEYFGYVGSPKEEDLKEFFNANTSGIHGIYWSGKGWVLGERGYEFDDMMGKELNSDLIRKVAKRMREQPDNILEHRNDALVANAYNYTAEVEEMANILEKGLKEGLERNYVDA